MSMQIRISYETDAELESIVKALSRPGMKVKPADQKGQYKRAYIKFSSTLDKAENFRYNKSEQMFD